MFMITASIVTVGLFTQTPKAWQDTQLDNTDRQAMEQLVSYAPPQIPTDATWIIPENESKDSSKPILWRPAPHQTTLKINTNFKSPHHVRFPN